MLEKTIEKYLVDECKKMGASCDKFTSPQRRSVPDRLICWKGSAYFVELKATDKKATPNQLRDHEKRRALGMPVLVINSKEQVDTFLNGIR